MIFIYKKTLHIYFSFYIYSGNTLFCLSHHKYRTFDHRFDIRQLLIMRVHYKWLIGFSLKVLWSLNI